jgi:hypothetical protein
LAAVNITSAHSGEITDDEPELMVSLEWQANALCLRYGSYRASVTKNATQLAEEMGHSVTMVQQNYREPLRKSQGKQCPLTGRVAECHERP